MVQRHADIFRIGNGEGTRASTSPRKPQWIDDALTAGSGDAQNSVSPTDLRGVRWLTIAVLACLLLLLGRLGYLQLAHGSEYRTAAEENRIRIVQLKAPRGLVYDREGTVLVQNVPNFILSVTPADLPRDSAARTAVIEKVSSTLAVPSADIEKSINQQPSYSYVPVIIRDHVPYNQAVMLNILSTELPGVTLTLNSFRNYTAGNSFSHLLGYVGKVSPDDLTEGSDYSYDDYLGKTGIELYYEQELRGIHGQKEVEVNSLGKERKVVATTDPTPGQSVTLAIDSTLQTLLGQALDRQVLGSKTITGAAAVAMDPRNGEVLALVSSPNFDSNKLSLGLSTDEYKSLNEDPKKPFLFRPVAGEYPSGSSIKPLIALAALQWGIITEQTTVMSTGGIQVDKWFFPDWKAGGHGLTDVKKALAESVNTFFYTIGGGNGTFQGLGITRMRQYLATFNIGSPLGIDLPNEASGFLPSPEWKEQTKHEPWYIGDTYHFSIGQGDILVTPLQVSSYTAAIANGGTLYRPHVLRSLDSADGKTSQRYQPVVLAQNLATPNNIRIVREGMRQAVTSGSARALNGIPVTAAAKTGTAQFGSQNQTHAWFTAFAPYDNPEFVITVILEAGGEGSSTALPIAKAAIENWFSRPHL